MKLKQKAVFYLTSALLVLPFVAAVVSSPALAYKCTGQTGTTQDYYRDGACYQPVGNTCLDNPPPANGAACKNRDTSKDVKVNGETPVKNDGSAITDWTCSTGTYNATKNVCETCNSFGACQTNANVTPVPKGNDTTVDPNANNTNGTNGTNGTSGNTSNATAKNAGGSGNCGGEKTDYFACGSSTGSDAIVGVIKIVITIASIGVGVVAVGGLVYGAILYASAQDNQDQTRKAVVVIRSVVIGVLLYVFMVAIINFLVPGGVFTVETTNNNGCSNNNANSNTNANQNTGNSNNNANSNNSNANCSTNTSNSSTNNNATNATNSTQNSTNQNSTGTNQTTQ